MPLNACLPDPQPRHHSAPSIAPQPFAIDSNFNSNSTTATNFSNNSSVAIQPRDTAAVQQEALRVPIKETRATGTNAEMGLGQPQVALDVGAISQLAAARRVDVQSAQTLHEVR